MGQVPNRADWTFTGGNALTNKSVMKKNYIRYMLARTNMIFEYDGLPETIAKKDFEFMLQVNGNVTITQADDGKLYAFIGGLGGRLNEYYLPTISVIANPYLNFNKSCEINVNCIVVLNDSMYIGLMPLCERYAELLTEVDISLRRAIINARTTSYVVADNDGTKADAERFFEKIENGDFGVIGSNEFFEGLKVFVNGSGQANTIKDLIELKQYLMSTWFIELGLNANYNMKRESINESESEMGEDALLPFIDDMLQERKKGVERINKMYGTNISVKLSSAWRKQRKENELQMQTLEKEVKDTEQTTEPRTEEKGENTTNES